MNNDLAFFSPSTGWLLTASGTDECVVSLDSSRSVPAPSHFRHAVTVLEDWENVSPNPDPQELEQLAARFHTHRLSRLVLAALHQLDSELTERILVAIEEGLERRVSPDAVLDQVLVAPLRTASVAKSLADDAFMSGLFVCSWLFDNLHNAQPLLRRLTDRWLQVPSSLFVDLEIHRTDLWERAARSGVVRKCMDARNRREFRTTWSPLQLEPEVVKKPAGRLAFAEVIDSLAVLIFPQEETVNWDELYREEHQDFGRDGGQRAARPLSDLQSVLSQVGTIVSLVQEGRDSIARRYVTELIESQIEAAPDGRYAVKSLCNIAKRCSDAFRSDFERECLDLALELAPTDAWALAQMADHFKRIGEIEAARDYYARCERFDTSTGNTRVARSGVADTWSVCGHYEKAIALYKSIPSWDRDPRIATAVADNLRRMERYDDAQGVYEGVEAEFGESEYTISGRAQIARKTGSPEAALEILTDAHRRGYGRGPSAHILALQRCTLLLETGKTSEALDVANAVLQETPFLAQARSLRGIAYAILQDEVQALADLPEVTKPQAWSEWLAAFSRGMALFRLGRPIEARSAIESRPHDSNHTHQMNVVSRLEAAFLNLVDRNLDDAARDLKSIEESSSLIGEHIVRVFWLHHACASGDRVRAREIANELQSGRGWSEVRHAVGSIQDIDWSRAQALEAELLLHLAAKWSIVG